MKAVIKIFLIMILSSAVTFFAIRWKTPESTDFQPPVEDIKKVQVEPLDLVIPGSLKVNFLDSAKYCNTKNIAQNGAFEYCMRDYIYRKNKSDYDILIKISEYCYKTTDTEYDRRKCIEDYME